jgi:septation ring formation regulator EzrA
MDTAQYVTTDYLDAAFDRFFGRMERMVGDMFIEADELINDRFDKVEKRLDKIEQRLDMVEADMAIVKQDVKDLQAVTMRIDNRLDSTVEALKLYSAQLRLHQGKLV